MKDAIITIGRQFGSGGRELGQLLSERLGIPFYDKQLLYQAAREAGMSPEFFLDNDERAPKFFGGAIPFSFGVNPLPWHSASSVMSDDNLYMLQSEFISQIASQGPCIIVGRTADYVLRDMPNLVSIFLHADIEDCVDRIISRSDCTDRQAARKMAERINKLRANYYNFYTDKRWGDCASYHLSINTSLLPLASAADLVTEYIARR